MRTVAINVLYGADQWDAQGTILRVNESLIARGYVTWFDLTNMKGKERPSRCALRLLHSVTDFCFLGACVNVMQVVLWTQ